jgi:hypothetical protein
MKENSMAPMVRNTLLALATTGVASFAWATGSGNATINAAVNKLLITTGVPSVSQPFTVSIDPQTGIIAAGATPPITFSPPITVFSNDPTALIKINASGQINYGGTTPITTGFTGTIAYSNVTIFGRNFAANGTDQTQPLGATPLALSSKPALTYQWLARTPPLLILKSSRCNQRIVCKGKPSC